MSFSIIFHPLSEEEFIETFWWYEDQKEGLGDCFEMEVDTLLNKISNNPEIFGFSEKPFREASLKKYPFTIVYKVNKSEREIYISAIYHSSRDHRDKYRI